MHESTLSRFFYYRERISHLPYVLHTKVGSMVIFMRYLVEAKLRYKIAFVVEKIRLLLNYLLEFKKKINIFETHNRPPYVI